MGTLALCYSWSLYTQNWLASNFLKAQFFLPQAKSKYQSAKRWPLRTNLICLILEPKCLDKLWKVMEQKHWDPGLLCLWTANFNIVDLVDLLPVQGTDLFLCKVKYGSPRHFSITASLAWLFWGKMQSWHAFSALIPQESVTLKLASYNSNYSDPSMTNLGRFQIKVTKLSTVLLMKSTADISLGKKSTLAGNCTRNTQE